MMRHSVIIAENFYEEPDRIVAYAHTLEYLTPYDQNVENQATSQVAWRSSRFRPAAQCPFKSSKQLLASLEELVGESIDRDHWNLDFPVDEQGYPAEGSEHIPRSAWWNCTFHSKHHRQELGEGVHSHTDRDTWNAVGADGWAGLLYLNKDADRQSGLRTWENIDPKRRLDWMTPKENWILCDTFANVYNRLIIHRGDIPHSGSMGWGNALTEGRFYQTFFFRTKGHQAKPGVTVRDVGLSCHISS